jgi:hypothetical protein
MMFYTLAAALCLAGFFIVLSGTFLLCSAAWRIVRPALARWAPRNAANLIFSLQVLPFVLGGSVALGFVLPAFLKFEPRATREPLNARLLTVSIAAALIVAGMAVRAMRAWWATARAEAAWRSCSTEIRVEGFDAPVHRVDQEFPFLVVAGLLRPRIFVGRPITQILSRDELAAALAHEKAHVRSFDNFKQLCLKITRLPGCLEKFEKFEKFVPGKEAWTGLTEIAADEDTLAGGASPVDLSAALIKVARLERPRLTGLVASQFVPHGPASSLELRVARLEQVLVSGLPTHPPRVRDWRLLTLLSILSVTLLYAICLGGALPWIYEALETLVR